MNRTWERLWGRSWLCWRLWMSWSQKGWGKTGGFGAVGVTMSKEKWLSVVVVPQYGNLLPGSSEGRSMGILVSGCLVRRLEVLRNNHALILRNGIPRWDKWVISITAFHHAISTYKEAPSWREETNGSPCGNAVLKQELHQALAVFSVPSYKAGQCQLTYLSLCCWPSSLLLLVHHAARC